MDGNHSGKMPDQDRTTEEVPKGKRFYWLKLQENFFEDKRIKFLRSLEAGDRMTIVYLKMMLKSLKTEGVIEYSGMLPSYEAEIALDISEDAALVTEAIKQLSKLGLIEVWDNKTVCMVALHELVGSETDSAQRMRRLRERKESASSQKGV